MLLELPIQILVIFSLRTISAKPRNLVLIWDKMKCSSNENYLSNESCRVSEPDHKTISIEATIMKDVRNFKLAERVYLPQGRIISSRPIIDWSINLCKFISANVRSKIFKLYADALKKNSNLPKKCPLEKGATYFVHNFTVDGSGMPMFMPAASFFNEISLTIPNEGTIFTASIQFSLRDKI